LDRLQSMAVFVRVAELGSFSTAARQLGLSKSAVSKHVTALEERLGVRLINRTTRRLALTEVGSVYRDYCARIVLEAEEAELTAASHGVEPRGKLKVNAPMTFGFLHLGPLLPAFLARHPGIAVELVLNDRFVDLLEEGYDVAVRIGRLADSTLIARRLATARFVCAASDAYLAGAGVPAQPIDLARHNCLRYSYRRQPDEWSFSRGEHQATVRVGGNLQANNGDALRAAACEGLGIVCLPDLHHRRRPGRRPAAAAARRLDRTRDPDPRRVPAAAASVGQAARLRRLPGRAVRAPAGLGSGRLITDLGTFYTAGHGAGNEEGG
jgi:DNA-binding transcriptional LysR family regulator